MGSELQIAFPKQTTSTALAIPVQTDTPANAGLAVIAQQPLADARRSLTCKDLLLGDTRQQAEQEAAKLYLEMQQNTQVFMAYGTSALEGVNSLIDRLLHEVEPTKIPELTDLMRGLNSDMRQIRTKYDVSDPEVRQKYAEWKGGLARFIGKGKTLVELLMEDVTSIETQLNKVEKTLRGKREQLEYGISYYDELYRENEAEIVKLIYVIGVMELIRDQAAADVEEIVVGNSQVGDRGGEHKARLAEFANNMDIKITEYKSRLFVAWSTSPQVRMMRTLNVGLAVRINELVSTTIPTMRATIVQWRLLMQAQDAGRMAKVVAEASNEWLQAYAAAGAEVVPAIAEAVQTPTLSPATVEAMAASVASQADSIIEAMHNGAERRKQLDTAILKAHDVLAGSAERVSDAAVTEILSAANANQPILVSQSVKD